MEQSTAGDLARKAQGLLDFYEVSGDLGSLESAKTLFDNLARALGPEPFDPPVAGLAEAYLLRYLSTGNIRDLADAFGLTVPARHTNRRPPPQITYVQGRALQLLHRRTSSIPMLDLAIEGLAQLNQPDGPCILKCAAAYAEALLDRHRLFPARETLDLVVKITDSALGQAPPAPAGVAACVAAFGRAQYQRALAAIEPDETYEGAPVIFRGLGESAESAVKYLRETVNSLSKGSPDLPLCLSRLADALVLLSRFKDRQNLRAGFREEAVSAAQTAAELILPQSPHKAAIHRSLAGALRWYAPGSPAILENLEIAAHAGAQTDLIEGMRGRLRMGVHRTHPRLRLYRSSASQLVLATRGRRAASDGLVTRQRRVDCQKRRRSGLA